jgi:hypothetical protein
MPIMKSKDNTDKTDYLIVSQISKNIELSAAIPILLIIGTIIVLLSYFENESVNAQTYNNVITFPDVNVTDSNSQNSTLDYEFLLVGNSSQNPLEVQNPDFGLNSPFVKLTEGQKYIIDPINQEDIRYSNISIKLAKVLFVPPDVKIQEADPEKSDEMTLGAPVDLSHYASGSNNSGFVMPSNLPPGNYILYAYLQYPNGITGVFSNLATVSKWEVVK